MSKDLNYKRDINIAAQRHPHFDLGRAKEMNKLYYGQWDFHRQILTDIRNTRAKLIATGKIKEDSNDAFFK